MNVQFALVRLEPYKHIRTEQRRNPVTLFFHAHDNDVVDDLGVIVQHRGIALAAEREIADMDMILARFCFVDLDNHFCFVIGFRLDIRSDKVVMGYWYRILYIYPRYWSHFSLE